MAITLPSGEKNKITKKNTEELDYTLNKVFDLIGEKREGDSWNQLKNSHISCDIIDVLSKLIKYDFFDLFNKDDARSKINDKQKIVLLSDAINYQSFARKIAARDKDVFIFDNSTSLSSAKLDNSIKGSFYEKYNSEPKVKYKPAKNKKVNDGVMLPTIIGGESDQINYNFPTNFLIPQDQFNHVLKTGRRWKDKEPQKNDIISSKYHTDFKYVSDVEMIMAGSKENIINYSDLVTNLKTNSKATEEEIKIWLHHKELTILRDSIEDDGYIAVECFTNKPRHYSPTFYCKAEVENFNPTLRFLEYQVVKEKWQKDFGKDENTTLEFMLKYFDEYDSFRLFRKNIFDSGSCPPRHKEYSKTYETDGSSRLTYEEKIEFLKGCLFEKKYIQQIEGKHFSPSLEKNQNLKEKAKNNDNNIQQVVVRTNLNSIILEVFKLLTASNNKLKTIEVFDYIKKNQTQYSSVIIKISNREIEWIVFETKETKIMKYKRFQNLVSEFRRSTSKK